MMEALQEQKMDFVSPIWIGTKEESRETEPLEQQEQGARPHGASMPRWGKTRGGILRLNVGDIRSAEPGLALPLWEAMRVA
jgi:hypothetical protein